MLVFTKERKGEDLVLNIIDDKIISRTVELVDGDKVEKLDVCLTGSAHIIVSYDEIRKDLKKKYISPRKSLRN